MILTGPEISKQVALGHIIIDPFSPEQINPNSYNFRLNRTLLVYTDFPVDPMEPPHVVELEIPSEGLCLSPQRLYLGSTVERLGSPCYAPTFAARSSVARLGLFINLSASLGDIGFVGNWTLQLHAVQPIIVYPYMEIGQMMFWVPKGVIKQYNGKYQGSEGACASLIHRDIRRLTLPVNRGE